MNVLVLIKSRMKSDEMIIRVKKVLKGNILLPNSRKKLLFPLSSDPIKPFNNR